LLSSSSSWQRRSIFAVANAQAREAVRGSQAQTGVRGDRAGERLQLRDHGLHEVRQIELQGDQHRLQIDDLLQPQRRRIDSVAGARHCISLSK
jgi:hypothetical protein